MNTFNNLGGSVPMDGRCIQDCEAMITFAEGPDANLYRMFNINNPLVFCSQKHRPVIQALAVIRPGVNVGVEVHQRHRSMDLVMGFQKRIGDKMIPTQGDHEGVFLKDLEGDFFDGIHNEMRITGIKDQVAVVGDSQ